MSEEPVVWHRGLVARWWAEFNSDGPEVEFFRSFIERFGEPVLDAACGTGRLLVPYLAAGIDVDGCDISEDMLRFCAQRAASHRPAPHLYRQTLHELELPRSYKTIVLCGAFGLGGTRSQDQEVLNRLFSHLEPGGALVFDHEVAYEWPYWGKEARERLPAPWPESGERKRTRDGDELELRHRLLRFDPLDQAATRQVRAILWHNGRIAQQEEHTLLEHFYFRNEVLLMLATAGFHDIQVISGYTGEPASAASEILAYVAIK
jgi:SAM-dependent methyltransferase